MQTAHPRRWSALAVIALAQFMVIMDTSIIGVALPRIQADVGFTGDDSSRSGAATAIVEWSPLSHLSVGGGWGWMYLKADGTISTDKDVHFSQTLNGPVLTLGIPF